MKNLMHIKTLMHINFIEYVYERIPRTSERIVVCNLIHYCRGQQKTMDVRGNVVRGEVEAHLRKSINA